MYLEAILKYIRVAVGRAKKTGKSTAPSNSSIKSLDVNFAFTKKPTSELISPDHTLQSTSAIKKTLK